jgi:hypothetical protein
MLAKLLFCFHRCAGFGAALFYQSQALLELPGGIWCNRDLMASGDIDQSILAQFFEQLGDGDTGGADAAGNLGVGQSKRQGLALGRDFSEFIYHEVEVAQEPIAGPELALVVQPEQAALILIAEGIHHILPKTGKNIQVFPIQPKGRGAIYMGSGLQGYFYLVVHFKGVARSHEAEAGFGICLVDRQGFSGEPNGAGLDAVKPVVVGG